MFAAPQCFGYRGEHGKPTQEICYPPDDVIVKQVKKAVKKVKAKSVFIGTDSRDLIDKMSKVIKGVSIVIRHGYNETSLKLVPLKSGFSFKLVDY